MAEPGSGDRFNDGQSVQDGRGDLCLQGTGVLPGENLGDGDDPLCRAVHPLLESRRGADGPVQQIIPDPGAEGGGVGDHPVDLSGVALPFGLAGVRCADPVDGAERVFRSGQTGDRSGDRSGGWGVGSERPDGGEQLSGDHSGDGAAVYAGGPDGDRVPDGDHGRLGGFGIRAVLRLSDPGHPGGRPADESLVPDLFGCLPGDRRDGAETDAAEGGLGECGLFGLRGAVPAGAGAVCPGVRRVYG